MRKQKAVFDLWCNIRIGELNRLLKPYGVRLVLKSSREWGDQVNVTAHPIDGTVPSPEAMAEALRKCMRALGPVAEDEDKHSAGIASDAIAAGAKVLGIS